MNRSDNGGPSVEGNGGQYSGREGQQPPKFLFNMESLSDSVAASLLGADDVVHTQ